MSVIRLTVRLWAEYTRQVRRGGHLRPQTEARWQERVDQLVTEHLPLAEKIARQVWRTFTRAGQGGYSCRIDVEDMISCAHIGLVEAARRYDPSHGEFPRFAYWRVRGAILERYRRNAYRDMQHESIDGAESEVAADRANGSKHAPRSGGSHGAVAAILSALVDPGPLPDAIAAMRERRRLAARAILGLPDDERAVIAEVLSGARLEVAAAGMGHSAAWARAKLAAGREKVAAIVQGRRAA
jgi:RNA polymerase sigma factor for flagellar operon FliA